MNGAVSKVNEKMYFRHTRAQLKLSTAETVHVYRTLPAVRNFNDLMGTRTRELLACIHATSSTMTSMEYIFNSSRCF
jgi:hypothetical protein